MPVSNTEDRLLLGFTTTENREDAERLASDSIAAGLVACAQVDAPVRSFFSWEGKREEATEYRLLLKFVSSRREAVTDWLQRHHPYDTPEWIVVAAEYTSEKYLQWAREVST